MKYKTLGAIKGVQNVPYCKAAADMKVGMGVVLDREAKTASLPADATAAKGCFYIVSNINDKPEMHNFSETLVIKKDEFVRADDLTSIANLEIELAKYEIKDGDYDGLVKGDKLVFGTSGLVEKAADVTGYKVYFEVIAKTAYMGAGIVAVINVQ